MNITATFIQRPVATTLLTIGVTLVGVVAFRFLPVAALPQVEFPTISVSAGLPGGSPEEIESQVTKPIEEAINTISNIDELRSTTLEGLSIVTVQFALDSVRAASDLGIPQAA